MKDYLYTRVQIYILSKIESMDYKPGKKIPSERDISRMLGISRMSVKNAINKLVDERILYRIHGSGTYVSFTSNRARMIIGRDTPNSFNLNMTSIGKDSSSVVISFKLIYNMTDLKEYFPLCNEFYELVRLREANDRPISIEYCYFPFRLFVDANRYDFSKVSLYDYMNHRRLLPVEFTKTLEVVNDLKIKKKLELDKKEAMFLTTYFGKTKMGIPVEYTRSYISLSNIEFKYLIDLK